MRVDVWERLLPPDKRARIPASKVAFHRDFALARAARGLARKNAAAVDATAVRALLAEWDADNVSLLVVFSGFWLPVALDYAAARPGVRVRSCHVDSVASPSFTSLASTLPTATTPTATTPTATTPTATGQHSDVWLLEERDGGIARTIPVSRARPVDWSDRVPRFLVHGGGWGMGTYATHARELSAQGLALDVVVYEAADLPTASTSDERRRHFMIDPDWQPWHDTGFPPFGQVAADGTAVFRRGDEHHDSFHLARQAMAVVSKPGGGTLMDSLSAATPVVLLEPFGEHEARNAELWQRLGFGVSLADWKRSGWSLALLADLHRSLLAARDRVAHYPDLLIAERTP